MAHVKNPRHISDWTFLSNHAHVLYCISSWPGIRIRDIAKKVRITERAVQRIVVDLERGGYLKRERVGRQNQYRLKPSLHLRHPIEHHVEVGQLLDVLRSTTLTPPGQAVRVRRTAASAAARRHKGRPSSARAKAGSNSNRQRQSKTAPKTRRAVAAKRK